MRRSLAIVVALLALLLGVAAWLRAAPETVHLLVCPAPLAERVAAVGEPGARREVLFRAGEWSYVIVEERDARLVPVQHYWPEHSFTRRERAIEVDFGQPQHVSSTAVFEPRAGLGVAVQRDGEWRWQRLAAADLAGELIVLREWAALEPFP